MPLVHLPFLLPISYKYISRKVFISPFFRLSFIHLFFSSRMSFVVISFASLCNLSASNFPYFSNFSLERKSRTSTLFFADFFTSFITKEVNSDGSISVANPSLLSSAAYKESPRLKTLSSVKCMVP